MLDYTLSGDLWHDCWDRLFEIFRSRNETTIRIESNVLWE